MDATGDETRPVLKRLGICAHHPKNGNEQKIQSVFTQKNGFEIPEFASIPVAGPVAVQILQQCIHLGAQSFDLFLVRRGQAFEQLMTVAGD